MARASVPTDDELRAFLLGDLPTSRSDEICAWLESDPAHGALLDQLSVRDALTDALQSGSTGPPIPDERVDRVIRGVLSTLQAGSAETSTTPRDAGTGDTAPFAGRAMPTPPEAGPHERFGQFRIIRELGQGGMGTVLEAEDEKLARRVAVKVLRGGVARNPEAAARFLREARAAAAIEHDNVVPILHIGEEGATPYLVMPLLKGESLDHRLKREGTLSPADVVQIGGDLAAGLAAAHATGSVHRDLKPANVWVDAETGRARILDFGLARLASGADALTGDAQLVGTPAYLAPEVIDGNPADARSDLFALGALLYECATGKRAFDGPTVTAILRAVADKHPQPPADVNPSVPIPVSSLIQRLLAKNPNDRPASAEAVRAALEDSSCSVGNVATAAWVSAGRKESKWRRRVWIGLGATMLLIATGFGLWIAARPSKSSVVSPGPLSPKEPAPTKTQSPRPVSYHGWVDVVIERGAEDGRPRLFRLNEPGALPMRRNDKFAIEAEIDTPAYLYLFWIDPGPDLTPVYPWDPTAEDWRGTRPAKEKRVSRVRLPATSSNFYRAWDAKPGISTVILVANEKPLDVADDEIVDWFGSLPRIEVGRRSETVAVWHENYAEVKEPLRLRAGFTEVGSADPFAHWQGALQKRLADQDLTFITSVSFARADATKRE